MLTWVQKFFSPTKKLSVSDNLYSQIETLTERVVELEKENRELHDLVLEIETSLKSQIDKIHPVIYNISDSNKGT
tara:strand:+ start:1039 stop:1263 length:225 start_codon:yes stop_codon:yes gene_type:complete